MSLPFISTYSSNIVREGLAHCASCDLKENLWLCLTCGSLGCGRPQFGGLGGNGHALAHHDATGHGVNVKLGTITPEGSAGAWIGKPQNKSSSITNGLSRYLLL